jgi:hypothetical protein
MNSIFISYRRDDSATICGRVFDSLERYFGQGAVFKDVDSIPLGVSFPQYISSVLDKCGVTLVVIGHRYLDVTGPDGRRRLDDPGDLVRIEVETALQRPGMVVLPVLVEGATMPPADRLPESLRPLTQRNGAVVRNDPDYQGDIRRLETAIESTLLTQGHGRVGASAQASDAKKFEPGRANRGLLITLGALVVLAALAVPVVLSSGLLSGLTGSGQQSAIKMTITQFCQALHDNNLSQAYSYFSPHYKQTITSPSDVSNVLSSWGTSSDCSEFGNGGFLSITGTSAQDTLLFTVNRPQLGTSNIDATVKFVQSSTTWQIDSIVA